MKMATSQSECEKFFRRLTENLSTDWEKVATQCGLLSGEIETIKRNNSKLEESSFQFLVGLRQRFPKLTGWPRKLREALRHENRNDLVEQLDEFTSKGDGSKQGADPTKDSSQVAAESCREALRTHYRTTGSYVQLIPWEDDDTKHIKDIFTDLTLEKSGKKLTSYKDIFLQKIYGNPVKRVILNGLPGRGKSTITDKMTYDWACDEALQQFELVFVLRMNAVKQSTNLIDSIFKQLLAEDTKIDKGALDSFIRDNQEKVLILLDGFDEFMTHTPALEKALFGSILKTLNRKIGRDCYVIVTTRTSHYHKLVTKSLIQEPFTQVRVEGFDKEDIKKYVERFYSEDHDKAKSLNQRIKSSNVLSDLAKSPMLLLFMCILYRDNSTLPETMSCIYSEALKYILCRKAGMTQDEISKVTNELGKVGLHGLLAPDQQLTFTEEQFERSVLESAIKAGILTRQKVKGMKSYNSIRFLHKTFQEFCAGKYLQRLLETDKAKFEKNLTRMIKSECNDFEYVLRFCSGDNMACTSSIFQTLAETYKFKLGHRSDRITRLGLSCYFEGQSTDLPPVELIQYVLTESVVIDKWDSDSLYSFTYFLRSVQKNKQIDYLDKVQSVEIQQCHLGGVMSDLAYFISSMVNLSSVTLKKCTLNESSEEYAALSGATSYPVGSVASLAHHFKKMKNLQKLDLSWCSLIQQDMKHIAPALCDLPNLVELNLEGNGSLHGSVALLAHSFKKMKNLQTLNFSKCSVTHKDLKYIVPILCDLPNLVELNLKGNWGLSGSAKLWAHHFKIKNLQKLNLRNCLLTPKDMTHIALAIRDLPNLVKLNLKENVNLCGSAALWNHHFKKMKNLHIVPEIFNYGAKALPLALPLIYKRKSTGEWTLP